jgi:hypothetical protein
VPPLPSRGDGILDTVLAGLEKNLSQIPPMATNAEGEPSCSVDGIRRVPDESRSVDGRNLKECITGLIKLLSAASR